MNERSFRLLAFNTYDENREDFMVQMFGLNEQGETASIFVSGYAPFFYIKVGDDWSDSEKIAFITRIKKAVGEYHANNIKGASLVQRKKLYGFDGGKEHTFMQIDFHTESTMNKVKQLWYMKDKKGTSRLHPLGYEFAGIYTELYEAQIPPLLRMFHIQRISPSGWVSLAKAKERPVETKQTSCTYEFMIDYRHIVSQPDKEAPVPYKIASYDIEASSSHGDFPLARKNYKKLATNIVDVWRKETNPDKTLLRSLVYSAFQHDGYAHDDIDTVYLKNDSEAFDLEESVTTWLEQPMSSFHASFDDPQAEEEEEEESDPQEIYGKRKKKIRTFKTGTVLDLLQDVKATRETKIHELTRSFNAATIDGEDLQLFPPLEGDEVTFIGTTFSRYGEPAPYLNHCIVKDTCADLPNAEIESYETEREVLLAWSSLIQREDPDIIIGYNIFGFDYQFMFQRAEELSCVKEFMMLSRNEKEDCTSRNWNRETKTTTYGLEERTTFLASGQHDIKFVNMKGRVQIDLYNYLRREYQLTKYKLDYVAGHFIGDGVKSVEHVDGKTKFYSANLKGLEERSYVSFEEEAHSVDSYKQGQKFEVFEVNPAEGSFWVDSHEEPDMTKKVRWGLAKDDVTPQDIFRMTKEGPEERSIIAKYCIQDCNLVHHLLNKIDVITGYVEMASLCCVPMDFLVLRGQGIKLTSYIALKCREKNTLMPVINKGDPDEAYEGAIVLEPKCGLYLDDPVACVDYSSLYPSSMISENISHDSKVWTKEYDLEGNMLPDGEWGEKDENGEFIYDNLEGYTYVNITFDTYKWRSKTSSAMEKVKVGYKTCRFAQFPDEKKAVMPAILEELLAARKATRKLGKTESDEFMRNVLDKRQLSIKVTANSMYGQTGAKTSTFYELDCAASTTAMGQKLLTFAKRVIEEAYANRLVETKCCGCVLVDAEYVYGDTDSVFFKFNPKNPKTQEPIKGQQALEITIELAQEAGKLATMFLKRPHDLEYEKTFMPLILLSKKRYAGMLYEHDPHKCKRKSMGIVLSRRDNAPIVKDVYGGILDILMKDKDIEKAAAFLNKCLEKMINEEYPMNKLVITKSLRGSYKNPDQIAHKVLADRIGARDPGNKPSIGDRVAFVYIRNSDKKALQGERIETPEFIVEHNVPIDHAFYITNQLMKPIIQVFALVLEQLQGFKKKKGITLRKWHHELALLHEKYPNDKAKEDALRTKEAKALLFEKHIQIAKARSKGDQLLTTFYK
jgi:DNA polymerase elongation subunit (family B)